MSEKHYEFASVCASASDFEWSWKGFPRPFHKGNWMDSKNLRRPSRHLSRPSKCCNWYWNWCGFKAFQAPRDSLILTEIFDKEYNCLLSWQNCSNLRNIKFWIWLSKLLNFFVVRDWFFPDSIFFNYKSVAKRRGAPPVRAPLRPKISSISWRFLENLAKSYVCAPLPWRVGAPSHGESLIRHCKYNIFCIRSVK